jgi:hypothetical protein
MTRIYSALDRNILCVATPSPVGWIAYIGIVEGRNHDEEMQGVVDSGTPLMEGIARAIFPRFEKVEYGK